MDRKEQFSKWLKGYRPGSADALKGRHQIISKMLGHDIYNYSADESSILRQAILDGDEPFQSLDKKDRNEYAVSLSRYSEFAALFPPIVKL